MNTKEAAIRNWVLTAGAALALAGCDRRPPEPEPEPAPTETARQPVSIIRDDIEGAPEAPPLAPLNLRVGFPDGGAELSQVAQAELETLLASPQLAAGGRIVLRGHSDSAGTDEANLRASQARAEAVRDWLVEHGVDEARITVIAMGEQNPLRPNALSDGSENAPGRAANRRVDVQVEVPSGSPAASPTAEPETLVDELTTGEN